MPRSLNVSDIHDEDGIQVVGKGIHNRTKKDDSGRTDGHGDLLSLLSAAA